MRRIQFYLEESLDKAIKVEASKRGVSRSDFVRMAIDKELATWQQPPSPLTTTSPPPTS